MDINVTIPLAEAADTATNRSAAEIVADSLRRDILRRALGPGERLRQHTIAARFGVSQTIAREAFKVLMAERFLTAEPRRGVSVATLDPDDAWEMTQLRATIEAKALEWSIPALTEADFVRASGIVSALDTAKSTDRIIALNTQFHEILYAPCGKSRTLALIRSLRLNFERYLRFAWEETPHLTRSQQEHRYILAKCRVGNVDAACKSLDAHILATGKLLVERLRATAASGLVKRSRSGSL